MKILLTILFIVISFNAGATNYYVKAAGGTGTGLDDANAWSFSKLNAVSVVYGIYAGDSVFFKRGDTLRGSLTMVSSGGLGNPIVYSTYGTGAQPVITGFTTVSSWADLGSNIWESTNAVSSLSTCNMVVINGINTAMGRYPNTGWKTAGSTTASSITDASLGATDWTGAEAVIRTERWVIDRSIVTSQSGTKINFTNTSGYSPQSGWGYFIQNDVRTLDIQNEWYYNPSTKKLRIYSTSMPIDVKVSSIDTLFAIRYVDNIKLNSITFSGANSIAVIVGACNNFTVQGCSFDSNYDGLMSGLWGSPSRNAIVDGCSFYNSQNRGFSFDERFKSALIINNLIENTALLVGMGGSGDGQGISLSAIGDSVAISHNIVKNSGYDGVVFDGNNSVVNNNLVDSACLVKDDGGGIYTFAGSSNRSIESNIVLNVIGNSGGVPDGNQLQTLGNGIYTDGWATNVSILNNTVANVGNSGIFANAGNGLNIRNNTVYNCFMASLWVTDNTSPNLRGVIIKGNEFIQKYLPLPDLFENTGFTQLTAQFVSVSNDVLNWGIIDSNYYARPIDDNLTINIQPNGESNTTGHYLIKNLSDWQDYSGYDTHSHKSPLSVPDTSYMRFEYNASDIAKTVFLETKYIGIDSTIYNGSITIPAWSSVVLIKQDVNVLPVIIRRFYITKGKLLKTPSGNFLKTVQ